MLSSATQKKLALSLAILSLSLLTAGCDDYDHHRHHPRHSERHEHERDRHRDEEHRRHRRDHDGQQHRNRDNENQKQRQRDNNNQGQQENREHRRNRGEHRGEYRRRHASALVGAYRARALNDAVVPKGTAFSVDVVQNDDDSLALILPTGKQYPIRYDAQTGTIADENLTVREDGLFVYKDAKGGLWLVEKK